LPSSHGSVEHVKWQSAGGDSTRAWQERMYITSPGSRHIAQIWWLAPFWGRAVVSHFCTQYFAFWPVVGGGQCGQDSVGFLGRISLVHRGGWK
jgi:hypothetical protein